MRRSVRFAAVALAAAAMTACGSDLTAPASRVPSSPSLNESCRAGYILSSGRCDGSVSAESVKGGKPITTLETTCRAGYILSSGRCEKL